MKREDRFLSWSYGLLVLGACSVTLVFWFFSQIEDHLTLSFRLAGFILWILSPFCVLALNIFIISRLIVKDNRGRMLFAGSVCFVLAGLVIYGRALLLPSTAPMEANFIFIFGPLEHFIVAVLITIVYFVRSFFQLLSGTGEKRRESP